MNVSLPALETADLNLRRDAVWGGVLVASLLLAVFAFYFPLWMLVAALALVAALVAVFVNPYLGSLAMLFLIYSRILQSFEIGKIFTAVVILTAAAWLVNMIVKADLRVLVLRRHATLIFAFLSMAVLSIFFAADAKLAFAAVAIYLKMILLYIVFVNLLATPRRFELGIYTVIFALVVAVGYGFYTYLFRPSAVTFLLRRAAGGGTDPNFFALSILSFLPIPFLFAFAEKRWGRRLVWLGIFLLLIAGIVISFSRAGLLGLAFVLLVLGYKIRRHRFLLVVAAALFVLLLFFLPETVWDRLGTLSRFGKDDSLRWRYRLLLGSWDLFLTHPFTGIGAGNIVLFSFRWVNRHQAAHNTYLEILAEFGIVAIVIFGLLVHATFRYLRSSYQYFAVNQRPRLAIIGEGLEAGLLGFLFVSLFLSLHYEYMFWVFLGMAGAMRKMAEAENAYLRPG
ncbi:MAG: hypothetical protein ALAOOOJD_00966 [bacterium]|nr:hypothetical protein [bacterium]